MLQLGYFFATTSYSLAIVQIVIGSWIGRSNFKRTFLSRCRFAMVSLVGIVNHCEIRLAQPMIARRL